MSSQPTCRVQIAAPRHNYLPHLPDRAQLAVIISSTAKTCYCRLEFPLSKRTRLCRDVLCYVITCAPPFLFGREWRRIAGKGLRACMMKYYRCICGGGRPAAGQWGQRGCRPGMKRAPAAVRPLVPLPHRTGGRGWGGGGGLKKVAWL